MKNAKWIEINGDQTYAPASLLKAFVMMAYYKEADETDNPGILNHKIQFQGSSDDVPGEIIPHLASGQYYTIDSVIQQMIVYSDNDALDTLINNFDPATLKYIDLVFKDLGIPSPPTKSESSLNFMSTDQYSMVFRVLFGSTYLSERYSEKALQLLSQAQYKDGIVAGVPQDIIVAHKFGLKTISTTPPINELHDCGIVYYPGHPYLLCIMTRGQNFAYLQQSIKDVSETVYSWLDQYYKNLPSSSPVNKSP